MRLPNTLAMAVALLAGCSRVDDASRGPPAASPASTESPAAFEPAVDPTPDAAKIAAGPLSPRPERNPDDLVRGCPGMNPEHRPRGSNCFGIFPEQCGTDLAARHVGDTMTPALAARMDEIAPGGARIIRPMEAVTDDLRYARLNVIVDEAGRVSKVDCY